MAINVSETLNLGILPVSVDGRAADLLATLPPRAVSTLVEAIKEWASTAPVTAISVIRDRDREATDWEQIVFSIELSATDTQALELWDSLAELVDRAKQDLPGGERSALDRQVAVHLDW